MESKLFYEFIVRKDKLSSIRISNIVHFLANKEDKCMFFDVLDGVQTRIVAWEFDNKEDFEDNLQIINECLTKYIINQ